MQEPNDSGRRSFGRAKKQRIILIGLAVLIVAALAAVWSSWEPTVDGRPISYWISQLGTSGSGSEAALDKLGPAKTIPYLLRTIVGKAPQGSGWQRFYRSHHGKIPGFLRQRLPAPQRAPVGITPESIQSRTAYYMIHLATNHPSLAGTVVPRLVPLIESSNRLTRTTAANALSGFGSNAAPAVPVIERLLKNNPEKCQDIMLVVLEKCGPNARTTIPTLKNCLDNTNGKLAIACARTLWVLDPSLTDLVRPIAKKLSTAPEARVRFESASLLWRIDKDPEAVVPVLIGLLNEDEQPYDEYRVVLLLKEIGPAASSAKPALTAKMNRKKETAAAFFETPTIFLKAADEALNAMGGATPAKSTTGTNGFNNK